MHHDLRLFVPTVKDVHSAAGQPFHAPASFAYLPDCPLCRYGTPIQRSFGWVCIDCGAAMTEEQIQHFSPL